MVYHSTLGLRVIKKKKNPGCCITRIQCSSCFGTSSRVRWCMFQGSGPGLWCRNQASFGVGSRVHLVQDPGFGAGSRVLWCRIQGAGTCGRGFRVWFRVRDSWDLVQDPGFILRWCTIQGSFSSLLLSSLELSDTKVYEP